MRSKFVADRISAHKKFGIEAAAMIVLVLSWTVRLNLSATELLSGEYGGVVCSVTPASAILDLNSVEVNSPPLSVRRLRSFVFD